MPERLTPDLCVIGADAGAIALATSAAGFGVPVVLVTHSSNDERPPGSAEAPLQALAAAARQAQALKSVERFGIKVQRTKVDFFDVVAHVDAVAAATAPYYAPQRLRALGIRVVEGRARFVDRRTVAVDDGITIRARCFVLASGAVPTVPPIPGLDQAGYLTERTIFGLTQGPRHLIVLGAGATGLALAQAHRRLGAEVTVLEAATPLAAHDPEAAAVVLARLAREGVALRHPASVMRVERSRGRLRVILATAEAADGEAIEGTHLLLAAGHRPNTDGLGLEAAGIAFAADGIQVDKSMRTGNRRVFAIGTAAQNAPGGAQGAGMQAALVLRKLLFRLPTDARQAVVPRLVRTDPELAEVGLSETEARRRHGGVRVLRSPYCDNERAQADGATEGHVKIIASPNGHILGATIVGAQAGELIAPWTLAISQSLKLDAVVASAVAPATFGEIGQRAGTGFFAPRLTNTWVRRIIGLLRRFG